MCNRRRLGTGRQRFLLPAMEAQRSIVDLLAANTLIQVGYSYRSPFAPRRA